MPNTVQFVTQISWHRQRRRWFNYGECFWTFLSVRSDLSCGYSPMYFSVKINISYIMYYTLKWCIFQIKQASENTKKHCCGNAGYVLWDVSEFGNHRYRFFI